MRVSSSIEITVTDIGPLGFSVTKESSGKLDCKTIYRAGNGGLLKFDGISRLVHLLGSTHNFKNEADLSLRFAANPGHFWVFDETGKPVKRLGWKDSPGERVYFKTGDSMPLVDFKKWRPNRDGSWVCFWYGGTSPRMLLFLKEPVQEIPSLFTVKDPADYGFRFKGDLYLMYGKFVETDKNRSFTVTDSDEAEHIMLRGPENTCLKHYPEMLYHRRSRCGDTFYDYAVIPKSKGGEHA